MSFSRRPRYARPSHHGAGSSARASATRQPSLAEEPHRHARGGDLGDRRPRRQLEVEDARGSVLASTWAIVADDDLGEGPLAAVGQHLAPLDPARQVGRCVDRRHLDDAHAVGQRAATGRTTRNTRRPSLVAGRAAQRPGGSERPPVEGDRVDALRAAARKRRA